MNGLVKKVEFLISISLNIKWKIFPEAKADSTYN